MTPWRRGPTPAVRAPRPSDDEAPAPGGGAAKPDPAVTPLRDHVSVDFSTPGFEPPEDGNG
jgi:hypothetical protein